MDVKRRIEHKLSNRASNGAGLLWTMHIAGYRQRLVARGIANVQRFGLRRIARPYDDLAPQVTPSYGPTHLSLAS